MNPLVCLAAVAIAMVGCRQQIATTPAGWTTDLPQALVDAQAADKPLLLEFTGSTWCAPCITMLKNVFSKPEFIDAASKQFVLVQIDVPQPGREAHAKDLAVAARNLRHARDYGIHSYPHIVLLSSAGEEILRFDPTEYPRPDLLLSHLDKALK